MCWIKWLLSPVVTCVQSDEEQGFAKTTVTRRIWSHRPFIILPCFSPPSYKYSLLLAPSFPSPFFHFHFQCLSHKISEPHSPTCTPFTVSRLLSPTVPFLCLRSGCFSPYAITPNAVAYIFCPPKPYTIKLLCHFLLFEKHFQLFVQIADQLAHNVSG